MPSGCVWVLFQRMNSFNVLTKLLQRLFWTPAQITSIENDQQGHPPLSAWSASAQPQRVARGLSAVAAKVSHPAIG